MRWITRLAGWFFALSMVFLVSSCSTLQPIAPIERSFYDSILIHGRFSSNFEQNNRQQSVQGRFEWSQNGQAIDIDLLSPLGQTLAKLSIAPGSAKIQESGKEAKFASNIAELTERSLGWALPVAGMRDWLQGFNRNSSSQLLTVSASGSEIVDAEGWRIHYVSWQQNAVTTYPKRIDISRTSRNTAPLSLRIVIDHWEPR